MAVREIRMLGDPRLYEVSALVVREELGQLDGVIADLHDTLLGFRQRYGAGRAIAAPQIGVMKRMIYVHVDRPVVLVNPLIDRKSSDMAPIWDDCMCFPDLLVKVMRHRSCRVIYHNRDWVVERWELENGLAELLQHECDHLVGILAVSKAIDGRSFSLRSQRPRLT